MVTVSHILAVSYHSVTKVMRYDKWQHGKLVWVVSFGIDKLYKKRLMLLFTNHLFMDVMKNH